MNDRRFLADFASELHTRGTVFDRIALLEFVADSWPLIADDPDASKWSDASEESHAPRPAPLTFNDTVIAHVPFTDGVSRDVFEDVTGRRYVINDDGERVYGMWAVVEEDFPALPIVVEKGAE
jgi:hypothetical protein